VRVLTRTLSLQLSLHSSVLYRSSLHVLAGWYSGGLLSLLYTHLPDISQGTVAIRLRCGGSFSDEL